MILDGNLASIQLLPSKCLWTYLTALIELVLANIAKFWDVGYHSLEKNIRSEHALLFHAPLSYLKGGKKEN